MMEAPYGTWESPITAETASSAIVAFQDVALDGDTIYWSEMRPTEGGRYVIVKYENGKAIDVLPPDFNARTRVHEYGGAAFTVYQGTIYFTNFQDQRLYGFDAKQKPVAITQEGIRFADLKVTPFGIVAVAESHLENNKEPKNFLALVNPQTGEIKELASGYDFYASPSVNQDFSKIAWISWNHPNMPWDDTQLWIANISAQGISDPYRVDEHFTSQAFFEPLWGPHNELVVSSDKSNWWNLYQVHGKSLERLFAIDSEIGQPLWNLGASTWGFYQNHIICTFFQEGQGRLFSFEQKPIKMDTPPYTSFSQLRANNDKAVFIAGSPHKPTAIAMIDKGKFTVIRENMAFNVDPDYLSVPEHITFASGNRVAHAFYYAPKNKTTVGKKGTKPPLIVRSHGGPTAQ